VANANTTPIAIIAEILRITLQYESAGHFLTDTADQD
jgi:hypothetical protein